MPLLHLSIPYDIELIDLVRQVPGVTFHKDSLLWEVEASGSVHEFIEHLGLRGHVLPKDTRFDKEMTAFDKTRPASRTISPRQVTSQLDESAISALGDTLADNGAAENTIKCYKSALKKLAEWWQRPLEEATREDLLAYLKHCQAEKHYSNATINQCINVIGIYYGQVLGRGKEELDLPRPAKEKALVNRCTEEEARRLLKSVRNRKHRLILTLIYSLNLRKGDVQQLLVSHVDLPHGLIHVAQAQDKKDRVLTLQPTLARELERYLEEYRPGHWLFEGQTGGKYSATSIQAIFVRAKEASRLPARLTVQGLRHSYPTQMVERGTSLHIVKDLLGHESIQTTQIYLHTSSKRLGDLYDPLAGL